MELHIKRTFYFPCKNLLGNELHGVFASNAKYRKEILPKYRRVRAKPKWKKLSRKDGIKSRHVAWAQLLWRSFGVMGWTCTKCGGRIYPLATTQIRRELGVNLHGLGCTTMIFFWGICADLCESAIRGFWDDGFTLMWSVF